MSLDLKFDHTKAATNDERVTRTNNDRRNSDDRQTTDIGRNQFALSLITRIAVAIGIIWTANTILHRIDDADKNQNRVQTARTVQR